MGLEVQSHARHRTSGIESDSGRKSGEGPGAGRRRSQVTEGPPKKRPHAAHTRRGDGASASAGPHALSWRDTPEPL